MNCAHCGQFGHESLACHRVKAIEYYENGAIKRIELHQLFAPTNPDPKEKFDSDEFLRRAVGIGSI